MELFFYYQKEENIKQGQTSIENKTPTEFFSEALRKTRSMCKQKRSLVFIQTAHAGTDLDLYDFIIVRTIEHAS